MDSVFIIGGCLLLVAIWLLPVVYGVKAARSKGISPHWMWFGLHPFGAWIAFLVIRFGVRPRKRCPQCAETLLGHAKVCAYCGLPLDQLVTENMNSALPKRRVWPAVALVIGGFLLFSLVFGIALFMSITGSFRHSDVARTAIARAQSDRFLQARLGDPIKMGFMMSGSINESGVTGNADLDIPLHGPKGGGDLYVVATKSAGQWTFSRLEFQEDGSPQRLNLLNSTNESPSPDTTHAN